MGMPGFGLEVALHPQPHKSASHPHFGRPKTGLAGLTFSTDAIAFEFKFVSTLPGKQTCFSRRAGNTLLHVGTADATAL